ncbi:unnamed protein product [Symbiodinium sp. CCMP2456]|nr:unnamed protein product [Symbiodinium sp. CCMP2456]
MRSFAHETAVQSVESSMARNPRIQAALAGRGCNCSQRIEHERFNRNYASCQLCCSDILLMATADSLGPGQSRSPESVSARNLGFKPLFRPGHGCFVFVLPEGQDRKSTKRKTWAPHNALFSVATGYPP